jgi:superfamily II DNA or RNA helicase
MKSSTLTRRDIERNLPEQFISRGEPYVREGRVGQLRAGPGPGRYLAEVEGTDPRPYQVEVQIFSGNGGARIYGKCTCPVSVNCKHVAAVLLSMLDGRPRRRGDDAADAVPEPVGLQDSGSAPRPPAPADALPLAWTNWLGAAGELLKSRRTAEEVSTPAPQRLIYVLDHTPSYQRPGVRVLLMTVRLRKDGSYGRAQAWHNARNAVVSPPSFVTAEDQRVLKRLLVEGSAAFESELVLRGQAGQEVLPAVLATGRCHFADAEGPLLRLGPAREAAPRWEQREDGSQRVVWDATPPVVDMLALSPPWYLDTERGECGLVASAWEPDIAWMLATMPPLQADQVAAVRNALEARFPGLGLPMPEAPREEDALDIAPIPRLRLMTLQSTTRQRGGPHHLSMASVRFDYDGVRVGPHDPGIVRHFGDGVVRRIRRDARAEKQRRDELENLGLILAEDLGYRVPHELEGGYVLADESYWLPFVCEELPALRSAGWQVEYDDSFEYQPVESGDWHAGVEEIDGDWFDLSLGVDVEGQRIDLLPILVALVRDRPELLSPGAGEASGHVAARLPDGRILPVPVSRVRPMAAILDELLAGAQRGKVRLPRMDAPRLASLEQAAPMQWEGGQSVRDLGRRLSGFERISSVSAPAGLMAELRPYQLDGLAWLQFLREYEVGGVLADDMGLGKTLQALSHILCEKEAGRLDRPALIVAPTSVVPNWRAEAARFAPDLKVHVSHGLKRKDSLDRLGQYDVVITTYPLLPRDKAVLMEQEFHLVILDEAQQVKNAQSQAAAVVRGLRARHRLCLSGTPLENHLGELWSLFHFLMPGFLGDAMSFRRHFRTPIEKHRDEGRRQALARRIRPFLLRRTKEQVASELPPKTEIVREVELTGAQRELYETVRVAMDERVRREIARRGLAQSQIVLLDALLKLRQVCCDPRLVKLDAARRGAESAKLAVLLEMLEELLAEGRRVLLFSQFAEMLALIEAELKARGIDHAILTGKTRDRAGPVQRFQAGEVSLFLISLKAGGTGLNLTAADTVILYDPWWNPAVERQAMDRAHRIGQTSPVFVYKLIVAGSVEEKIARLQADKSALAEAILGDSGSSGKPLAAADIEALFQPLAPVS